MYDACMRQAARKPIQFYVSPEMKVRLDAAAETENISVAAFCRRVVSLYLSEHGY